MKLRSQCDRKDSIEPRGLPQTKQSATVMQTNSKESITQSGSGVPVTLQTGLPAKTPSDQAITGSGEIQIPIGSAPAEHGSRHASRRSRGNISLQAHGHSHRPGRTHSHCTPEGLETQEPDSEATEPSSSISELRHLLQWLHKSFPFIVILCAKLIVQHALGIAVGIGLLTTFLYVNKSIQSQVFLRERRSKLQCSWLLLFLTMSSILLYCTFQSESLYYSLIFMTPNIEPVGFWDVLWIVGVTVFILKFCTMGVKCLILLLPAAINPYRSRGCWYMLTEEVSQIYQAIVPVPVWFRYLITYQEEDGYTGLTLGVVLALVYLMLKLLGLYGQWSSIQKALQVFLNKQRYGVMATKHQCSEAGDVCPVCQAEFCDPCLLVCQHIFCEECISLWFNLEKTCPLCRTVITDSVHKWKEGATSLHLQIY
ncbi:E3 ubiquitin-protein ligase RNFT1 isoform X1 [Erpetoichthys calabaricus]|uniref:E3 ubiquitin-protein ligase RNFT1 n=2 Tax=Erpetoichthys calabaricus TaxID=27687 RepID=A0A8C4SC95_ERPCA|nr:E3 ubiquitin-protein ligase RNFT1 isoform X1 [Erpetoichthys calabaricus]